MSERTDKLSKAMIPLAQSRGADGRQYRIRVGGLHPDTKEEVSLIVFRIDDNGDESVFFYDGVKEWPTANYGTVTLVQAALHDAVGVLVDMAVDVSVIQAQSISK